MNREIAYSLLQELIMNRCGQEKRQSENAETHNVKQYHHNQELLYMELLKHVQENLK